MRFLIFLILIVSLIQAANAAFVPKSFVAELNEVHKAESIKTEIKYMQGGYIYYTSFDTFEENLPQLIYVCNPKTTYKYVPPFDKSEKGELTKGDSNVYCYSKVFEALTRGLKDNELYKVKLGKKSATLTFSEKASKQLGLLKIEFTFKNESKNSIADIASMVLYFEQKPQPTKFELKKFNIKQKLNKADFEFQVPENTNVKEMN